LCFSEPFSQDFFYSQKKRKGSIMKSKQSSSNNILHIPSSIDQNLLDDKMAYFINDLYNYPFTYKHRVKSQVMSQKNLRWKPTETDGFENLKESSIYWNSDTDSSVDVSAGSCFSSNVLTSGFQSTVPSNVLTSEDFLMEWNGYVPIYSKILEKYFTTKDYIRVRDDLINNQIIDVDWSYSNFNNNKFPMEYSLNELHRFSQPNCYELKNKRFISKLQNMNETRKQSLSPLLQILEDKLHRVDFDYSGGRDYVSKNIFKSKKTNRPSLHSKLSRMMGLEIMKYRPTHIYHLYEGQKIKRVFSPITSLPSDMRKFISYKNQSMWDVDISAAIPTLFNIHLKDLDQMDVKLYRNLTSEYSDTYGLYEYLGEIWGIDDRDEVKKLTMVLFFGNGHTIREYRYTFNEAFPNVYKRMKTLKRGNYKYLAKNLMDLEREIMINTVVRDLLKKDRNTMVLTIHDGMLVTEEYTGKTKLNIQKSIQKIIGIIPKVKVKSLM